MTKHELIKQAAKDTRKKLRFYQSRSSKILFLPAPYWDCNNYYYAFDNDGNYVTFANSVNEEITEITQEEFLKK